MRRIIPSQRGDQLRYVILFFLSFAALAQTLAGGKWKLSTVTDKMTDAKSEQFSLSADSEVEDLGLKSVPTLSLLCTGSGKFNGAQLDTGVVLAVPDNPESHLYMVKVRFDSKFSNMFWNKFQDGKSLGLLDPGFLGNMRDIHKILRATDIRIQLPTFSGHIVVARFSPAGLDRGMLAKSCGLK
jgi:hypothetical protein